MFWPGDLEPAQLRQPDRRSCGAAAFLAALALVEGWRPHDAPAQILGAHKALTSARSARERFQTPWPRALGTPPWALANALGTLSERRVATVNVRPRPAIGFDVLAEQVALRPTAVYVGSRWLPRHVVLAIRRLGDAIEVFDPARGELVMVDRERWESHRVQVAGWTHFWFVV